MTSLAHRPVAVARSAASGRAATTARLKLVATGDGYSLVTTDGRVVFEAPGKDGRRRCLEFARAEGVLTVFG